MSTAFNKPIFQTGPIWVVSPEEQEGAKAADPQVLSCPKVTEAVNKVRMNGVQELKTWLENNFRWYSNENHTAAQDCLEALSLAGKNNLRHQFVSYQQTLLNLCTRDLGDRTAKFARQQLGCQDFRYYIQGHRAIHAHASFFDVPIEARDRYQLVWRCRRIHDFSKTIPLHALRAMNTLEEIRIEPDEFWVADKMAIEFPRRVQRPKSFIQPSKLDPVLCAVFGDYFVGLAEWI